MTGQPEAATTKTAAALRGHAIIAVLQALDVRDELARLGALIVLMAEASIAAGNVPNFSKPMLVTWTTLAGQATGMRVQIESEPIVEMREAVL